MKPSTLHQALRRTLIITTALAAGVIVQTASAQVEVYSRGEVSSGLWWDDVALPWNYSGGGNQNRPDNPGGTTANWVKIGHNNNTTMMVNGAFFRLGSLEIQGGASSARTYNSSDGGGWSFRTSGQGFTNVSTGNQTINVPVGIDASTVVFRGNAVSTNTFNGSLFLNANTADFGGSAGGSLFVLAGDVSGTGGSIIKTGDNTLVLSGNNSYTGTTDISNGVVRVNSNNGLGATNGGTTVRSGATLQLNNGISTAEAITLNGTGVGGTGSLRSTGLLNTNTGGINLGSSARIAKATPALSSRPEREQTRWPALDSPSPWPAAATQRSATAVEPMFS